MKIKINGDKEKFAKRLFYLAWQGCGGPLGMGILQNRPNANENDVFNNVLTAGDYACNFRGLREVYGDYVFGRMMKFGFELCDEQDVLEFRDGEFRRDYQGFSRVYPNLQSLLNATAESVGLTYEVVS